MYDNNAINEFNSHDIVSSQLSSAYMQGFQSFVFEKNCISLIDNFHGAWKFFLLRKWKGDIENNFSFTYLIKVCLASVLMGEKKT